MAAARYLHLASTTALLLVALLADARTVSAQGTGVIEGYVRDRRGVAQADVPVILKGGAGIQVDRTQTNSEGHYIFSQIGAGVYFITLEIKGVPGESKRVEFVTNEADGHRREDFTLETGPEARGPAVPVEPVFIQQVPERALRLLANAQVMLRDAKSDEAIRELQQALQEFPNYFDALNLLAMEYLKRGDVASAGPLFERAVAVNRNSASARFGLGWAFYQAGKFTEAARELNQSVKLNPGVSESFWYLGRTHLERKQWAAAEEAFSTFRKLYGKDDRPMLHLYLTSVYDALGRSRLAVESLEAYLKAVPEKERTSKLLDLLERLKRKRDRGSSAS